MPGRRKTVWSKPEMKTGGDGFAVSLFCQRWQEGQLDTGYIAK